jgi:hypothetical protein
MLKVSKRPKRKPKRRVDTCGVIYLILQAYRPQDQSPSPVCVDIPIAPSRDMLEMSKKLKKSKKSILTRVGFEPTHISVVEIQAGLKSTALDHSAIVSDGEIEGVGKLDKPYPEKLIV